eukprot:m.42216 g.42216  ORF g.42216 m.42216 type:complete len:372 (+) comp10618_c0_seq2:198-1313(+)
MAAFAKKLVSKKKRRFQKDGFDLDMTFINENIVAMGFPAEKMEGVYRNNMKDVQRFFDTYHKDHYKVYNLCEERDYDPSKFHDRVAKYPFADHNAPPFLLLKPFCEDVSNFLAEDPKNVAVIHCKAGKGRTGVMICAYMLFSRMFEDTQASLDFYADKRTHNKKGVTIPSQLRYVHYYGRYLREGRPYAPPTLLLTSIKLNGMPNFSGGTCVPQYIVSKGRERTVLRTSLPLEGLQRDQREIVLEVVPPLPVQEDIRIEFFHRKGGKEKMFQVWFNTHFIDDLKVSFQKPELDKANKDKKHKLFPADFTVELTFAPASDDALAAAAAASAEPARSAASSPEKKVSQNPSDSELTTDDDDDDESPRKQPPSP